MLTREQQREILALGLLALSLFLFLSLFPVSVLGARGEAWFPSGNAMGSVGFWSRERLVRALGVGSVAVPVLLMVGGIRFGERISREQSLRLAVLVAGLLLLVPSGLYLMEGGDAAVGWVGRAVGGPLTAAFGRVGGVLVLLALLILLSVGTLRWNPAVHFGRLLFRAGGVLRVGVARAAGSLRRRMAGREVDSSSGDASSAAEPDAPEATFEEDEPAAGEPERIGEPESSPAKSPAAASTPGDLPDPTHPRDLEENELPSLDLLTIPEGRGAEGMDRQLDRLGEILVEKLRTFNVDSELGGRTTGPTVTQFEVVPAPGVKVNRIANLDADLALAMKARSIRIVAPIPGKGAVGVEIPNPSTETVYLRELLEAPAYRQSRAALPMALGKGLTGDPYVGDLARMPHLLIAGATGSGKSVCINTIVTSLLYRHAPETLRLLMIDPKMVELSAYVDLPHLRHPVVTDPHDAAGVLKWAVMEMERRYELFSVNAVRSIAEFNRKVRNATLIKRTEPLGDEGDPDRWIYDDGVLPYVVLVVDELADLMMTVQSDVEKPLTLLAQKARAIGIHLIVATQRPSVNVITGLIKANFPSRVAFRVASKIDSRTILDQNGAEALLGNGDMLFLPPGQNEPLRMQGAFIPTEDTEALMDWYRERAELRRRASEERGRAETGEGEEDILELVQRREVEEVTDAALEEDLGERDELFRAAAEVCIQYEQGSTSLLQRRLRVGYGRAARIVDQLHEAGILGPPDGSKPRELLVSSLEELDRICEELP